MGFAKLNGFSPTAEVTVSLLLLFGAVAGALLGRLLLTRPGAIPLRLEKPLTWAGLWLSPILASTETTTRWVVLAGIAGFVFLGVFSPAIEEGTGNRRLGMPAAIAQAIIVWTFAAGAVVRAHDSPALLAAVSVAVAIAEAAWLGRGSVEAAAGAFAPTALLTPLTLWRVRPIAVSLGASVLALLLPILAAAVIRRRRESGLLLRAGVRYLLLPACVVSLAMAAFMKHAPRADLFEDGHPLLPASEYLRGELPYRDIVPGHGLIADGLLQAAELRVFGQDYRGLSRGDRIVKTLFWPSIYSLGYAATGSAAVGFWALLLTFASSMPETGFLRLLGSLIILAPAAFMLRRNTSRGWALVGAAVPAGLLIAVEFAAYAAGAAVLSLLFVGRGPKRRNLAYFLAGGAATLAVVAAVFGGLRILGSFAAVTFRDLRGLFPRYRRSGSPRSPRRSTAFGSLTSRRPSAIPPPSTPGPSSRAFFFSRSSSRGRRSSGRAPGPFSRSSRGSSRQRCRSSNAAT